MDENELNNDGVQGIKAGLSIGAVGIHAVGVCLMLEWPVGQ
ncbi:MAG: hypothetical protein OXE78_07935 [Gammaproteobacteria bacterium]|nr:hypothetical protein [Gammaproteobacteria bacterium]MCY4356754.1 hypothetical protein [Gammaproteobacteria bacterium]